MRVLRLAVCIRVRMQMLKCFEFQVCDTVIIHVLDSGTYQLKSIRVSEEYLIVLRKKKIVV